MKDILMYFTSPVVLLAVVLVLVMIYFIINRPKEDEDDGSGKVAITTKDMLKDVNEERRKAELYEVPEQNTGNLARMDKSLKNEPDLFRQLFRKKD